MDKKEHQGKNWGGKRTGAGRPVEERPFSKQKKPTPSIAPVRRWTISRAYSQG